MKKREFFKILNTCLYKLPKSKLYKLDRDKVYALAPVVKTALAMFIIKERQPVLADLIDGNMDFIDNKDFGWSWLHSMGYLYTTQGKEYKFYHTCAHTII